jgi:hypothetical protein
MKLTTTLLLPLVLVFAGCDGDDATDTETGTDVDSGDTETDTDMGTEAETSAIVGDWNSSGDDVAPLLSGAPLLYADINASFETDGTYEVVATNTDGNATTFSGTYSVDASTEPNGILLVQTVPQQSESNGIFEIDGTTLTYEVVQTTPDFGFVAPTPTTGFGSTSGNGIAADVNTQVFVAQ